MEARKAAVLRAVVEEYIETAQPVGSGHVARAEGVGVSSATVRNEMAQLEAEGYLLQPHTSAGRIPTEKGYRFFVDQLGDLPGILRGATAEQVHSFFARTHGELERMLSETSRLLSNLTHLTSVVVAPGVSEANLRSVSVVPIAGDHGIVVLVLSDGTVEKHTIELPSGIDDESVAVASAHLASTLAGTGRRSLPSVAAVDDLDADTVVQRAIEAIRSDTTEEHEHVYVGGTANMAQAFDALETVREVLTILEQQFVVVSLLQDVLDRGLHVAIGTETGMEPLSSCALVVAPYEIDGERAGTVGVLGPTRMNYPDALAAVAVVSNQLSDRLSE